MRFTDRIKFLTILIALVNFLFLISPSRACAQPKPTPGKEKITVIFVDDFDVLGNIPADVKHIAEGGPTWLGTALTNATDQQGSRIFKLVERKKINRIMEEAGGIQQKLSTVFDQTKVRDRLKAEGAQYVIFTTCASMGHGRLRLDSRAVKVEDLVMVASEFSIARSDDQDPLQPLADKLTKSFMKTLFPKIDMRDKGSLELLELTLTLLEEDNPNNQLAKLMKTTMSSCLNDALLECQKEFKPRRRGYTFETSACRNVAPQLPSDIDYFILGEMTFVEGNKIRVTVTIFTLKCDAPATRTFDIDDVKDLNHARTAANREVPALMEQLKRSLLTGEEKVQGH